MVTEVVAKSLALACLAAPGDEAARLVLADALEDLGLARTEVGLREPGYWGVTWYAGRQRHCLVWWAARYHGAWQRPGVNVMALGRKQLPPRPWLAPMRLCRCSPIDLVYYSATGWTCSRCSPRLAGSPKLGQGRGGYGLMPSLLHR